MLTIGQIIASGSSSAVQVAVVVVGCLVFCVAFKIGIVILKIALGLVALALLGGVTWWFLSGMDH